VESWLHEAFVSWTPQRGSAAAASPGRVVNHIFATTISPCPCASCKGFPPAGGKSLQMCNEASPGTKPGSPRRRSGSQTGDSAHVIYPVRTLEDPFLPGGKDGLWDCYRGRRGHQTVEAEPMGRSRSGLARAAERAVIRRGAPGGRPGAPLADLPHFGRQ
jgi:hypothetical protein